LSLNQWQSLNCMLHTAVPEAKYTLTSVPIHISGTASTFVFVIINMIN